MKLVRNLIDAIKRDKTYLVVAIITVILIAVMMKSHRWVAAPQIERLPLSMTLPDFTTYDTVDEKKSAFFEFLMPYIRQENQRIRYDRAFLESIENELDKNVHHQRASLRKLRKLANRYKVEMKDIDSTIAKLKLRVDIIPMSLVLVQAANESAWGTSRFARQANNLFGQWCYAKGCGLVPSGRDDGARHKVRVFETPKASIVSYMRNLNTHAAYQSFRKIRAELRSNGRQITGIKLAEGLKNYSERRGEYVRELVTMIEQNDLE